ncbi:glycosyltransferase [Desulfobulbus alkaliphilus]|uniref:glycosyltransferase n=1 Tax=Desulfobulbus alkaliphilus TaxID=869814 RepID=UPI001966C4ED|nr:glycosyltransferase family 2 protein [Desulfobulbus alkaliphilus]
MDNRIVRHNDVNIGVVIPAYNEGEVIASVVDEVAGSGAYSIIVVDDGSSDDTFEILKDQKVLVLRHRLNRGKGAAVKTGVMAANRIGVDIVVTLDGDGQHDPNDIPRLVEPIIKGEADVVLGSRMMNSEGMPRVKVIANYIGNFFTWLFYGILVTDSQSGFRAYSYYAAKIIDTKADKYEYDSKVIREVKNNRLRFKEIPITVRYTEYSMGKPQKQGLVNGLKTLYRMVWNLFV